MTNGREALLFISPTPGVKCRLAATIRAAYAGGGSSYAVGYLFPLCFFYVKYFCFFFGGIMPNRR